VSSTSSARTSHGIVTIVSKNYLALARTLAESVRVHHPEVRVLVLLVDRVDGHFDPAAEPFELIELEQLTNIPVPRELCFKYNVIELNTAVKPFFFEHLMRTEHLQKLIFLDPDILVLNPLDEIFALLDKNSLVVTPHMLAPVEDALHPGDFDILRAGTFNLGFLGMRDTATTSNFLSWWQRRLYDYCAMDPDMGMHVDQNWLNLVPVLFGETYTLMDPRYNVAYWNLHERGGRITQKGEELFLDGRPIAFFHFSGFESDQIDRISKHQNRFTLDDLPQLRPLFESYREALARRGYAAARQWPYAYGTFSNGVQIPDAARRLYRQLGPGALRFGNPFASEGEGSFFEWLNQPAGTPSLEPGTLPVTRLLAAVYDSHADLQFAFPDPLGRSRDGFVQHMIQIGIDTYKLDRRFLEPLASWASGQRYPQSQVGQLVRRLSARVLRRIKSHLRGLLNRGTASGRIARSLSRRFDLALDSWPRLAERSTRRPPELPFGVNVAGYVTGGFGVAEAARGSVAALTAVDVPVVVNRVRADAYSDLDDSCSNRADENPYRTNLIHVNADQVEHFARTRGWDYLRGRRNVGYWYWEVSRFPDRWRSSFRYFDEIWVATSFCQDAISRSAPVPVVRVPAPVLLLEEAEIRPDRAAFGLAPDNFIFLFSFDYLSVFERKNPLAVVEAFRQAFGSRKDVTLVLKSINANRAVEQETALKRAVADLNVRCISAGLERPAMLRLLATCDCFISLHRSEGFGLGLAQAMALGKPVIGTGYSGNMDFMNESNSFLVRYELTELEHDYGPYEKGNVWAEPSIEHAAELMRLIQQDPAQARAKAARGARDVRRRLAPAACGATMLERLRLLTEP
jgi:glycosyltransferase involved in cell wall biosynthesis/lipopolysaccharide biosynthesis glycosyltransferase